jgi:hypothetical protein
MFSTMYLSVVNQGVLYCLIDIIILRIMVLPIMLIIAWLIILAIYLICSLRVPWLANNKAFVCLFVVYVNYDLWINLLKYVKWVFLFLNCYNKSQLKKCWPGRDVWKRRITNFLKKVKYWHRSYHRKFLHLNVAYRFWR